MLGFVQNLFAPKGNPIGVDFGSDALRMAQVQLVHGEHRLVAAATADVPSTVRHDVNARFNFFVDTVRELIMTGKFRGRQCVLGLPAAAMFIQHLRMPKMDADGMKKALPWELRGKLPIDPSHALLRHIVAGDVFEGQEAKSEVIVMAAAKEMVHQFLAAASKAKLDVVGMNVEPRALVDCFTQIYKRKSDEGVVNCYVDIGAVATRATIACGNEILFARTIPVGGDHFSRAAASGLSIKLEEAKILRVKIGQMQLAAPAEVKPEPAVRGVRDDASIETSFALLAAGVPTERREPSQVPGNPAAPAEAIAPRPETPEDELARQAKRVEQACADLLRRLVEELELCRRYYETTFPQRPVERLIFVGGEARQKNLCMQIAKQMQLSAQVGDPLVRVGKNSDVGVEAGIDRRQPQPGWAVAIGLSMGPAAGSHSSSAMETAAAATK
jgi:type IV pilus assembly protein PilM